MVGEKQKRNMRTKKIRGRGNISGRNQAFFRGEEEDEGEGEGEGDVTNLSHGGWRSCLFILIITCKIKSFISPIYPTKVSISKFSPS